MFASNKKMSGAFNCSDCGKYWRSASCWPNNYQICSCCYNQVYPTDLKPQGYRKFNLTEKSELPHRQELCGKCEELGYCCVGEGIPDIYDEKDEDEFGEKEEVGLFGGPVITRKTKKPKKYDHGGQVWRKL